MSDNKQNIGGVDNPTYDSFDKPESYSKQTDDESRVEINGLSGDDFVGDSIEKTTALRQMSIIAEPVSMSWHNINVFTEKSSGFSLPFKKKTDNPVVHILKNVNGQVKSGKLLAIMGASGAGKTTLINVLTQRNLSNLEINGVVKLNDKVANINNIIALSAYVQQDDLFIGTLTVREHLRFQSKVRMAQNISNKTREKRVVEVLTDLGLTKCADTRIGWPAQGVKGISGGEMKRLAFASELLTNPSLMFCDEPTSGLDSFMAMSVVEVLKDMAAMGRTVICTIHQPSSEVFAMFDQLLLMADGRVAYLGELHKAVDYFSSLRLHCPTNYNPADFYIKELAVIPGKEVQTKEKLKRICDNFNSSTYSRESMPQPLSDKYTPELNKASVKLSLYKASWLTQFNALLWRAFISVMREPMITTVRVIQTVFIAVLLGFIYFRQTNDQQGIMNINGALFLLVTNMNFSNAFAVINTFCVEIPIFMREHNNGMYRVDTYFLTKMMAELPTFIVIPALFVAIFYFMVGFNSDIPTFLICIVICVLVANCACSFGYFVSCVSSSITMALSIGPPIMIPMLIFGGFFLNNDSVPVYFIWFKYISWFYYGNEALVINQWQNVEHIDCGHSNSTVTNGTITACMPNGKVVIKTLNFVESNLLRDCLLLLTLTIALRLMAFIALLLKSRKR